MLHAIRGFFIPQNFFWKSLTVLSGNYFSLIHEASQADIKKISSDILSDDDKVLVDDIIYYED